jgi:hypothetical protein
MSRASGAAQVVELLSSKRKALSSTPKDAGKKNFKNKNFKFLHAFHSLADAEKLGQSCVITSCV